MLIDRYSGSTSKTIFSLFSIGAIQTGVNYATGPDFAMTPQFGIHVSTLTVTGMSARL